MTDVNGEKSIRKVFGCVLMYSKFFSRISFEGLKKKFRECPNIGHDGGDEKFARILFLSPYFRSYQNLTISAMKIKEIKKCIKPTTWVFPRNPFIRPQKKINKKKNWSSCSSDVHHRIRRQISLYFDISQAIL